jgi:hypothetical protein
MAKRKPQQGEECLTGVSSQAMALLNSLFTRLSGLLIPSNIPLDIKLVISDSTGEGRMAAEPKPGAHPSVFPDSS